MKRVLDFIISLLIFAMVAAIIYFIFGAIYILSIKLLPVMSVLYKITAIICGPIVGFVSGSAYFMLSKGGK